MSQPVQPLMKDENGTIRFKPNQIIRWLADSGRMNLNEIAALPVTDEDRCQLAQLLGYSVSGYADLSYVSDEEYKRVVESRPDLFEDHSLSVPGESEER